MTRLVYRPAALADLDAIFDYIAADNDRQAHRFIKDIRARTRALASHPELGPARPDLGPGIRILPILGRVVVAYRIGTGAIEIVRVLYGGQDYEALLRGPA